MTGMLWLNLPTKDFVTAVKEAISYFRNKYSNFGDVVGVIVSLHDANREFSVDGFRVVPVRYLPARHILVCYESKTREQNSA